MVQSASHIDRMQTESTLPASSSPKIEPGEGSSSPSKRSRAAGAKVPRADAVLHDLAPDEAQRVLRRRMTNRMSAMRMRAKRQQELDEAQMRVTPCCLGAGQEPESTPVHTCRLPASQFQKSTLTWKGSLLATLCMCLHALSMSQG